MHSTSLVGPLPSCSGDWWAKRTHPLVDNPWLSPHNVARRDRKAKTEESKRGEGVREGGGGVATPRDGSAPEVGRDQGGSMQDRLVRLEGQAISELEGVEGEAGLQQWKVKYLGRSSELAEILDGLRKLPKDERPAVGKQANQLQARLEGAFAAREQTSRAASPQHSL